jgi:hypothetical protein
MFAREFRSIRRLALLIGLLLSTAASGFAQEPDPAFARYVDLDLLASAWEQKDPELLTDLGLQLLEGERVLLRSHKAISADQVFAMAVKVAGEKRDVADLKRLAATFEKTKKTELADEAAQALRLASEKRGVDPALTVQIDQVSPAVFLAMQALLDELNAAKASGNRSALDAVMKRAAEAKVLSEAQRRSLVKMAAEARDSLPEKEDVNPAQAAMNKLLADSRAPQRGGSAPARQPAPVHHNPPPAPVHHNPPPAPVHHNPPPIPVHHNPPPIPVHHNPPPIPVHHNPPPITQGGGNPNRPTGRPNNTIINNTIINNVTRIRYNITNLGFVIGGSGQWNFTSNCTLDPGDVIVSVGGVDCGSSGLSLQQLVNQAYQGGNLDCVVKDVNTGNLDTVTLDPADGNQGGGDDGNGGNDNNLQNLRFLTIRNSTGEDLTVDVQYFVLNDQNEWAWLPNPPGGGQTMRYTIANDALTNLLVDNNRVAANRVRIWATSASGRQWNGFRDRDLMLVTEPYNSQEIGAFTFTFNP